MAYSIEIKRSATKALSRLPTTDRIRIGEAIDKLAEDPRRPDANIKALQGALEGKLRLRVGNYRIIYEVNDRIVTVYVLDISQRGGAY